MKPVNVFAVVVSMLWSSTTDVWAQQGTKELGLDAGMVLTFWEFPGLRVRDEFGGPDRYIDREFDLAVPVQRLRVGYHVTENFQFEPSFHLTAVFSMGELVDTFQLLEVAGLYHFAGAPGGTRPFVLLRQQPFSSREFTFGLGLRAPVAEQRDFRLESGLRTRGSAFSFLINLGFSFRTS